MGNPYSDANPYLIQRQRSNAGNNLINLGLKLYSVKKGTGIKIPEWKIGGSNAGGALEVPKGTTETNLSAFDFGKGGESVVGPGVESDGADLSAFDFSTGGKTGGELIAPETDVLSGLDAFELGQAGEYGALTEAELAGYAAEDAAMAEQGITAGQTGGSSGAGTSVGGVVAIVGAADMARNMWGRPNKRYEDKSTVQKMFAAPVMGVHTAISEDVANSIFGKGNPLSKMSSWLGQAEENIVGKSLDKAFQGNFTGAIGQIFKGIKGLF